MNDLAAQREKNERNARVQARYDALMAGGKHGHYETMFKIVREEVEAALTHAHVGEQCVKLRDHLSQALRQWQMYAELERDRDLKSEQSHEGELFRELLAALTAPPGDGWQPIETAPEGETVWTCWDGVNNRNEQ